MKVLQTPLPGALILEPRVFEDERGFFLESYSRRTFFELGICEEFVQDNHSFSKQNVLRGLHYQVNKVQGKLVRVASGEILDVFVDLRLASPSFGKWHSVRLSGSNHLLAWIPVGFAHGFYVISHEAHVLYKSTEFYFAEHERTILWNDPDLRINWQNLALPILSGKDERGVSFRNAEKFD
jgi:dTDP-4-dehydrorhamnose 3,5-epimerase